MKAPLTIWLIARAPQLSTKLYAARKWILKGDDLRATSEEIQSDSLEEIRKEFRARDFTLVPKSGFMSKIIVETWIEPERDLTLVWKPEKNFFIAERPFTFFRGPVEGKKGLQLVSSQTTIPPGPVTAEFFYGCYSNLSQP